MWCSTEDNRHPENRHRVFRMECVRRDPGQSQVPGECQTAVGRISSVWISFCRANESAIHRLLENIARHRPTWIQTVASVGQHGVQVCVEKNSRQIALRLLQCVLSERKLSSYLTMRFSREMNTRTFIVLQRARFRYRQCCYMYFIY